MAATPSDISTISTDWKIPRPSLLGDSHLDSTRALSLMSSEHIVCSTPLEDSERVTEDRVENWVNTGRGSGSSTASTSRSNSASTASSSSLLLNPTQLLRSIQVDTQSVASSTHFTVVNGMPSKEPLNSYCRLHQLPILVVTMTILFFLFILSAVLYIEVRATDLRRS